MLGMHLSRRRAVRRPRRQLLVRLPSTRTTASRSARRISESSWYSPARQRVPDHRVASCASGRRGRCQQVVVSVRNARVRNQRDRERSDLVATVAHELRSPLTGIKGFTATLLTKWDKFSEEQRQLMLETVDADADRLSRLITELLDAARIDAGRLTLRPSPVELDEVARRVLSQRLGRERSSRRGQRRRRPAAWSGATPTASPRCVTNLVENAMRHGSGCARSWSNAEAPGRPRRRGAARHDNGAGHPERVRARMFSRFWRSGPGRRQRARACTSCAASSTSTAGPSTIEDAEGGGAVDPRVVPESTSRTR